MAGTLRIRKQSITEMDVDCIVNAANSQLRHGGGVCGAIFAAAGTRELQAACDALGHCPTGEAVITPGFKLKAKYIVHAVGPIWQGSARKNCGKWTRMTGWLPWRRQILTLTISFILPVETKAIYIRRAVG